MNKKIFFSCVIIILIIIISIFIKNNYKNKKTGNNINKSADNIIQNILNIESYKAKVKITIKSNKTTNTYEAIQKYHKQNNLYEQEITSPKQIAGTMFKYNGKNLELKNTKLNLNKIYKNYYYIGSNELGLNWFIEDYNNTNKINSFEEENKIIVEIEIKNNNKYKAIKKLQIDKKTGLPEKMEVQDVSNNTLVYILYKEIEINNL